MNCVTLGAGSTPLWLISVVLPSGCMLTETVSFVLTVSCSVIVLDAGPSSSGTVMLKLCQAHGLTQGLSCSQVVMLSDGVRLTETIMLSDYQIERLPSSVTVSCSVTVSDSGTPTQELCQTDRLKQY